MDLTAGVLEVAGPGERCKREQAAAEEAKKKQGLADALFGDGF